MTKWKEELERRKFIKENPDTMELFDNVVDQIFGEKEHTEKDSDPSED